MNAPTAPPTHPPRRRAEVAAWALYDTANSAFFLIVVTAFFPFFFRDTLLGGDVARGDALWGAMLSASAVLVALSSPVMGALAEARRWRKALLAAYTLVAVCGTALLGFGSALSLPLAVVAFVLANAATEGGMVFYGALLPSVASRERLGRVSGLGWAVGYLGSVVALIFAHVVLGGPTGATMFFVAAWFALFALPLFVLVEDRTPPRGTRESALAGLRAALRDAWRTRDLRRFLVAFFLYNDGVTTTIAFAALFAKDELGFPQALLVGLIVGIQVTGAIGAALLGGVADRRGNVFAIGGTLVLWLAVTLAAFGLSLDLALWEGREQVRQLAFLGVGLAVGFGLGAVQSQSRALLVGMVPESRTAEFMGLYAVCGRASAIVGPAVFGALAAFTGSKSASVLFLAALFAGGLVLLRGVDEQRGRRELLARSEATG